MRKESKPGQEQGHSGAGGEVKESQKEKTSQNTPPAEHNKLQDEHPVPRITQHPCRFHGQIALKAEEKMMRMKQASRSLIVVVLNYVQIQVVTQIEQV